MSEPTTLRDASVQDIQLELIRRTQFNAMDGERVHASLMAHRHLWTAALLDRIGVANYAKPRHLLMLGLIKLRDLPGNAWNADTLFLLTKSPELAWEMAKVIEDEDWAGEVQVYEDREETDDALGVGREEYGLLSVWWD